jgi:hypothetical protein
MYSEDVCQLHVKGWLRPGKEVVVDVDVELLFGSPDVDY